MCLKLFTFYKKKKKKKCFCFSLSKRTIIVFMKPKCLRAKLKKKRQVHAKEKQQLKTIGGYFSQEECLKNSPGYSYEQDSKFEGEYHVLKQFSHMVYPDLAVEDGDKTNTSRDGYSLERLLKVEEIDRREMCVSSSRRRIDSLKKRVSFRLPEEADTIIFYSPKD